MKWTTILLTWNRREKKGCMRVLPVHLSCLKPRLPRWEKTFGWRSAWVCVWRAIHITIWITYLIKLGSHNSNCYRPYICQQTFHFLSRPWKSFPVSGGTAAALLPCATPWHVKCGAYSTRLKEKVLTEVWRLRKFLTSVSRSGWPKRCSIRSRLLGWRQRSTAKFEHASAHWGHGELSLWSGCFKLHLMQCERI